MLQSFFHLIIILMDADEVHQIVSGEGEREGEGAAQDRDAQDVDLETLDEEEDEAAYQPADQ